MTTFVCLHGAWGVPQEWDGVIAALVSAGHQACAVDLPIHDPSAGLEDYADCVLRAAEPFPEPVVIVAHSAAGRVAAMIPARLAVRHVVYIAAFVPLPRVPFLVRAAGEPIASARGGDFELATPAFRSLIVEGNDGTCSIDVQAFASFLAGDAAADLLVPMLRPLLRPNAVRVFEEPFPRDELPRGPSTYLLTAADPVLPPASQRVFARRLGLTPVEIAGADHGVHRKRPRALAALLGHIATGS